MDKNDAVALNRVYEETLAKERRAFRLRETFTLNPKKMDAFPPKPNLVVNGEMPEYIARQHGLVQKHTDPTVIEELNQTLAALTKVPTEKYLQPATSAQEVGWLHTKYGTKFKERKYHGLKSNNITKYAEAYSQAMGRNPFQKKPPIVKEA